MLFSLQKAIKIQQNAGEIKQHEIDFFVKVSYNAISTSY